MRGKTLVISVALHAALLAVILWCSRPGAAHRATAFAVVTPEQKKPEPKKEEPLPPPPPPPKPHKRAPVAEVPAPAPAPEPLPPPEPAPAAHPRAISTGLTLGNGPGDAAGMAIGGLTHDPPRPRAEPRQVARHDLVKVPPPPPEEDRCTEAPTRPEPLVRPTDIEYSAQARADGVEGRLVLRLFVAADGTVIKVEVLSAVEPALDAAAIAAVKTWKFKPALACGKPVSGGVYTLARRFELGD